MEIDIDIYYERASALGERSLFNITEKSQYERPGPARPVPARPGPARPETLLGGSYISNHLTDSLAVIFRVTSSLLPRIGLFRYM